MKHSLSSLLLTVAGLSSLAQAGDHWYTTTCWETKYQECEPSTVWQECLPSTVWKVSTETQIVYKTVYSEVTTTEYQDVPTTIYQNVPTTVYQNVPTTLVEPVTVYVTQVQSVVNSETFYNTVENTVTEVEINTAVQYQTVTVTDVAATTVSVTAVCPTSLTGLVLCPSRIVNPTYTPATPLPTDYIWGCPPGSICEPTKDNCNFERDVPADTYVCPPEQCQIAGPLPSIEEVLNNQPLGTNCAWLTPDPGYFDLDPTPFGYTYGIFNIFGQPQCPAQCPPPSTVTVTETAQAPPPATVYVTVTVTVTVAPPPSSESIYYPPPSSTWQPWSQPVKPTPSTWQAWSQPPEPTPSTWDEWSSKPGWPKGSPTHSYWGSKVTPRAQLPERAVFFPMPCYNLADHAQKLFQSIGSNSARLCPGSGPFSIAYNYASSCYSSSSKIMPSEAVARLSSALAYCSAHPVRKREPGQGIVYPRRIRQL